MRDGAFLDLPATVERLEAFIESHFFRRSPPATAKASFRSGWPTHMSAPELP